MLGQIYIDIVDGVPIDAVVALEDLFATGGDKHGAADTILTFPRAVGDGADVAGSGDPDVVFFSNGSVVVDPESTVGILLVVVVAGDSPSAGREDDLGPHSGEGSADDLALDERIGADHDADFSERGFYSGEGISGFVVLESRFDFVDFAMNEEEFAG